MKLTLLLASFVFLAGCGDPNYQDQPQPSQSEIQQVQPHYTVPVNQR